MKALPCIYYCLQGKGALGLNSDTGIEKKIGKKVPPNVEDRTLTVRPLCTALVTAS